MGILFNRTMTAEATVAGQSEQAQQGLPGATALTGLKRKSVRGGAATVLGQGVGMALQIGTTLVLARLLSPTDYGLQSMVLTLTAFFALFKDFRGYAEFFMLQDLLTHDYSAVRFFMSFDDFNAPSVPRDRDTYKEYRRLSIEFIKARNCRIERYAALCREVER